MRLFALQSQSRWSREQFFVERPVEDAGDIAILVETNAVARVFQACFAHGQSAFAIFDAGGCDWLHVVDGIAHWRGPCQEQNLCRAGGAVQLCRDLFSMRTADPDSLGRDSGGSDGRTAASVAPAVERIVDGS